jgi:phospholipid transport system substrate-binding protein
MNIQFKFLILLAGFMVSSMLHAQDIEHDPATLLKQTTNNIFIKLNENMEEFTADPSGLQQLIKTELMPLLDIDYAARLILGRAGRGIEKEKIDSFSQCMSTLLISRYATGLLEFRSTEQLQVLPLRGELNEKLTRVRSRLQLSKGGYAPIDYAFHKTAAGWKAFDVIVEGISYVTTYRNQIMPDVQANGIDSVIARLSSGELELTD